MEEFFASNACPECATPGAGFKLHGPECARFGAVGEHMHRHCGACGHEWAELARLGLRRRSTAGRAPASDIAQATGTE